MQSHHVMHFAAAGAACLAVLCGSALGQDAPAGDGQNADRKGLAPRAAPADYQKSAQAGKVTVAAEFKRHSVPTADATFSSEDYVAVEVGIFGPPDVPLTLSQTDFVLRISAGKSRKSTPLQVQPYALVFRDLKDPEWVPPTPVEPKSKGGITGGGGDAGGGQSDPPPATPKMPFELVRAMQQKVQKSVLPEGQRTLPVAGLIFFSLHGKTESIRSIDLVYDGPGGKATLSLQ
jgi:hypothetical protein